ncbi:MAG: hypothetical protein AAF902_08845 [Chloroflexota bacterium]
MRKQDLIILFEYNYWARDQLLSAAQNVVAEFLSADNTTSY